MEMIPLTQIAPNPDQPRKKFDPVELSELAASIRENGLIQPITVVQTGRQAFMIVAGERRWRAHNLLAEQGGATEICAIVQDLAEVQIAINAIVENDCRSDVTLMEQARSYARMTEVFGYTVEALAEKLGKPVHRVEHRLRLLNLTDECQHLLERGQLYETQAYYLAGLSAAGQGLLLRQINKGMCRTVGALKDVASAIEAAEAQTDIFGEGSAVQLPEPATVHEISAARGFEAKIESVAAMLRAGIEDNTITAVKRVNPGRAATIAALLAEMQKDMHRLEKAFRVAAVQEELAA